jgi:hypothetical protein
METQDRASIARGFAFAAWLLVLMSMWMPWWQARYSDANHIVYDRIGASLWQPTAELSNTWGPWVTGVLVVWLALWLFVRIAARSYHYEPKIWHRDLWLTALLAGIALATTALWPDGVNFERMWSTTIYGNPVPGNEWFEERTQAGVGWWTMGAAFLCLVVAYLMSPPENPDASDK